MLVSLLLRSLLPDIIEPELEPELRYHVGESSRMANSGHNSNTNPKVPALWVPAGSNISGDMQCVEIRHGSKDLHIRSEYSFLLNEIGRPAARCGKSLDLFQE